MKKCSAWLLAAILLLVAAPVILLIVLSFLSVDRDLYALTELPQFTLSQYQTAFANEDFLRRFANSVKLTGISLLLHLPVALLSGLALARLRFRGKKVVLMLYILGLLLPFQVVMLPVYQMSLWTNLYDSHWAVILLATFSPLGTMMIYAIVRGIPEEHWEAAAIETDSLWQILRRVILPQILPGLAAFMLVVFSECWNMVEQPLILLLSDKLKPLSLLFNDITKGGSGYLYAGSALYAAPILIGYGFASRFLRLDKAESNGGAKPIL